MFSLRQDTIHLLPKGRDFTSLVSVAPGANQEPKLGGISITARAPRPLGARRLTPQRHRRHDFVLTFLAKSSNHAKPALTIIALSNSPIW